LSDDGHFRYLGGSSPIEPALADRAQRLALAALACFPATRGYVGVDLILGQADDGSGDVVVEVNPRLTTSYVGLRRLLQTNLATAMLAAAAGRAVELRWARQRVEFTAEGQIL
jgi:predicted ATP-grasp superfamily ATP-dependent carboligase